MLIKVDTLEYPVTDHEFRRKFPNMSFPLNPDYSQYGYEEVHPAKQPSCTAYQTTVELSPKLIDGKWVQQWGVVEITDPDKVAVIKAQLDEVEKIAQKQKDIVQILPCWLDILERYDTIKKDVTAAKTIDEVKNALVIFIEQEIKMGKVTYWLGKNSAT